MKLNSIGQFSFMPPWPSRPIGSRSSSKAKIVIEVALCLACPFSKIAWNAMKEIKSHYKEEVEFRKIDHVQPWHPQSYILAQAAAVVELNLGHEAWYNYTSVIYDRFDEFLDDQIFDKSINDLIQKLGQIAVSTFGVSLNDFLKSMNDGSARQVIKHHIIYSRQNGLHVSPTYLVNGLILNQASSSWSLKEWSEVIDPLLK